MNPSPWSRWAGRLLLIVFVMLMVTPTASAAWKENVLYSFQGGSDGYTPAGGVVFDKAGSLYGANSWGGSGCLSQNCGTVFQLSPPVQKGGAWTETTIHAFQGLPANDGYTPVGGLIIDSLGNLYGTTSMGGNGPCVLLGSLAGCGIVFQLSPPAQQGGQWTYSVLYNFQGNNDGYFPWGDLVLDKHGSLYGATQFGGGQGNTCNDFYGGHCGTVFRLSPPKQKGGAWKEKILHRFAGGTDGANPNGGLILDGSGAVYGTTFSGGSQNCHCYGTVFKLIPPTKKGGPWKEKLIYRFQGGQDAATPGAGVTFGKSGNLYGTTIFGPQDGYGTIFEVVKPSGKSHVWKDKLLYRFSDGKDGNSPQAGLIPDAHGNLYGTARDGNPTWGSVFKITPPKQKGGSWTFSAIYGFRGAPDGGNPTAGLIFNKQGNLYGTTQNGGTGACNPAGCGTVFEVTP